MALWRRRVPSTSSAYNGVEYQSIPANEQETECEYENHDDVFDAQFLQPPVKIPWSAVMFAAVLCLGGAILLLIGSLLLTGYIDPKYVDRTWPLLVLGSVMFIPGLYHMRIAVLAFFGCPGYSFEDIPAFD